MMADNIVALTKASYRPVALPRRNVNMQIPGCGIALITGYETPLMAAFRASLTPGYRRCQAALGIYHRCLIRRVILLDIICACSMTRRTRVVITTSTPQVCGYVVLKHLIHMVITRVRQIDRCSIGLSDLGRNLGIICDRFVNMNGHVTSVCRAQHALIAVVHVFATPRIVYYKSFYMAQLTGRNSATRMVTNHENIVP